jgi:hypothetical protein
VNPFDGLDTPDATPGGDGSAAAETLDIAAAADADAPPSDLSDTPDAPDADAGDTDRASDGTRPPDLMEPADVGGETDTGASSYTRPAAVDVPPLPPLNAEALAALPRSDAGRPIVFEVPGMRLEVDVTRRGPLTVHGACTAMISECYAPPTVTLDACVVSAPLCATATPWEEPSPCCPAACRDAYEAQRRAGRTPMAAADEVFFQHPDCFPGVAALLRGRP